MAKYGHGQSVIEMPFVDFAPDLAYDAGNNKGVVLIDMDNAMPTIKGYQTLNSLMPFAESPSPATGTPAPEMEYGSTLAYFSDGTAKVYFGGPTQLWRLDGNAWVSVGSGFNTDDSRWRFAQFGDDLIAVNANAAPQVARTSSGKFAPLGGNPPKGADIVVSVNGQVLMFQGSNWYCSALGTDSQWQPDIQTQAGAGVLYDFPGNIVAAAPLYRNVIVFKETATWLGSYSGGTTVWSWQLISGLTGTWCAESVIVMPESIAFVGADDFYTCSGWAPQRIPNSLKEWFFDICDPQFFDQMLSRYDAMHGVCYWYFVSRTPPIHGVPDRWVGWNSRSGRWGAGYISEQGAYSVPTPNQQPGLLSGLFFTADWVLRSWTGAPGTARYETGYFGVPNLLTQCMRVRPMYYVRPDSATVLPWHVRSLGDADISGGTTWLNQKDGWYYFRQYDGWHRFQLQTTGPSIMPTTVSQTGCEVSALAFELRQGGWR